MVSKREKGKIDHAEWALIMARHNGGETFASIARSYGCTAPAIRYIVNRQARQPGAETGASPATAVGVLDGRTLRAATGAGLVPSRRHDDKPGASSDPLARSGIDRQLREQVNSDIAAFLVAFDAALLKNSMGTRAALLEATDRLLRAGARTRITLEQMTADDAVQVSRALSTTAG
jgi:hypothetical protein